LLACSGSLLKGLVGYFATPCGVEYVSQTPRRRAVKGRLFNERARATHRFKEQPPLHFKIFRSEMKLKPSSGREQKAACSVRRGARCCEPTWLFAHVGGLSGETLPLRFHSEGDRNVANFLFSSFIHTSARLGHGERTFELNVVVLLFPSCRSSSSVFNLWFPAGRCFTSRRATWVPGIDRTYFAWPYRTGPSPLEKDVITGC